MNPFTAVFLYTMLSFPIKSDTVSLFIDVDHQEAPPSYHPKIGEAGLLKDASFQDVVNSNKYTVYRSLVLRTIGICILLMAVGTIIVYSNYVLCKASVKVNRSHIRKMMKHRESNSTGLHNSSISRADAEHEITSVPPPAHMDSDYEDRFGFDPIEDIFRELSEFSIDNGMSDQRTAGDVLSTYNQNFEIDRKKSKVNGQLFITKSARYIHDFRLNITGIVDVEGRRCYVMPLVQKLSPPKSIYDYVKMFSGFYPTVFEKFLSNMRVVEPAVTDLSAYGLYISKNCADYSTYKLEKVDTTLKV